MSHKGFKTTFLKFYPKITKMQNGGARWGKGSSNIEFHAGSYPGPPLTYFNEGGGGGGGV